MAISLGVYPIFRHTHIIFGDLPGSHPPHFWSQKDPIKHLICLLHGSRQGPVPKFQAPEATPCESMARGVSHPWAWVDQHWAPAKHLELHPTDEPARPNSWLLHGVHGGVWNPKQLGACKSLWRTTITWLQHYEACDAAANRLWCKRASAAVGKMIGLLGCLRWRWMWYSLQTLQNHLKNSRYARVWLTCPWMLPRRWKSI